MQGSRRTRQGTDTDCGIHEATGLVMNLHTVGFGRDCWNLSVDAEYTAVKDMYRRQRPLILIACPKVLGYSNLPAANIESDVQKGIKTANQHLARSLDMCVSQDRNGRYFVLEHSKRSRTGHKGYFRNTKRDIIG